MSRDQALSLARENGYDLVLIAADDKNPVCKIADFGKMKYETLKQEKEARKKQKATTLKELKVPEDKLEVMADKATSGNRRTLGNFVKLDKAAVLSILKLAR